MSIRLTRILTHTRNIIRKIKTITPTRHILLQDYTLIQNINYDYWTQQVFYCINIYDNQNNDVKAGYISYIAKTGQIALFFISSDYRNRGLGKQVLLFALNDMKTFTPSHIWAITYINHPFWSNVFNKSFKYYEMKQLHPSVTGSGYKMQI